MGIGGVSIALLARFLHTSGVPVSGTDAVVNEQFLALEEAGIPVWTGFLPEKTGKPGAVVYSSAISKTDPEYLYLSSCGVPMYERYVLLGAVNDLFQTSVAIAGTHGKTTTTAMISAVLKESGKKLFAHIGGQCADTGDFLYTGRDYFVCEACEYRKSLLALRSDVSLVLNAEFDHPDTYRNLSEIYDTFDLFLSQIKPNGIAVINRDDPYFEIRQRFNRSITFGFSDKATYRIDDVREWGGKYGCSIRFGDFPIYEFDLAVVGKHNLYNAAACAAVCHRLGIDNQTFNRTLSAFRGVGRRFEYKGLFCGARVYSDYAHHPTEIAACLRAGQSILEKGGKLTVVFQPHTFSRTEALKNEFVASLRTCDRLILLKEYAARERSTDGMSCERLFYYIDNKEKYYCETIVEAATLLTEKTAPNDVIIILGAGDVEILSSVLIAKK